MGILSLTDHVKSLSFKRSVDVLAIFETPSILNIGFCKFSVSKKLSATNNQVHSVVL